MDFCGRCGGTWQETVYSQRTVEIPPWQAQDWSQRPRSPRRQRSPRATSNGKGKGKQGKQGQPPGQGKGGNALRPFGLQSLPLPPKPPQPPSHGGPPAPRSDQQALPIDDTAQKTLDALMHALSRQDRATLPLEIQRVLDEKDAGDSKKLTKMVQASKQGAAKQELQALREERVTFLSQWDGYLEQLIETLTKQLADKEAALAEYHRKETALVARLNGAVQEIARIQASLVGDCGRAPDADAIEDEAMQPVPSADEEILRTLSTALQTSKAATQHFNGKRKAPPETVEDSGLEDDIRKAVKAVGDHSRAVLLAAGVPTCAAPSAETTAPKSPVPNPG